MYCCDNSDHVEHCTDEAEDDGESYIRHEWEWLYDENLDLTYYQCRRCGAYQAGQGATADG